MAPRGKAVPNYNMGKKTVGHAGETMSSLHQCIAFSSLIMFEMSSTLAVLERRRKWRTGGKRGSSTTTCSTCSANSEGKTSSVFLNGRKVSRTFWKCIYYQRGDNIKLAKDGVYRMENVFLRWLHHGDTSEATCTI